MAVELEVSLILMVSMYWTIVTQHALPLPLVQTKRSCLTPFVTITSLIVTITIAGIVVVAVVAVVVGVVGVVGVVAVIVVGLRSLSLDPPPPRYRLLSDLSPRPGVEGCSTCAAV